MRKIFSHCFSLALLIGLLASCKKDGALLQVQDGAFGANALTASKTEVVLLSAQDNDNAVSFNWSKAAFGDKSAITYTLQMDLNADNDWSNAKTFAAGNNTAKYDFTVKELNGFLNTAGLPAEVAADVAIRVKADVNQYNGAASNVASSYSNTVVVKITPYKLDMYIPGDYQGWDPSKAPLLSPVTGRPGLYEAYVYMADPGQHYFKYTNARDWNHTNYGDGGNGTFSTDGNAAGLSVPTGGYYELTADLNTNRWTATKTTWGLIGDASPGGWDNDTPMSYDPATQVWTVTANMKTSGSFKFRANNGWSINFGIDNAGNLKYADNPFFGSVPLNNLTVPSDGNYTLVLDLHISGKYTYTATKN